MTTTQYRMLPPVCSYMAIPGVLRESRPTDYGKILYAVADYFKVSISTIKSRSRAADKVMARHVAMLLIRRHTPMSLTQVGELFGRDHTSVMHGIKSISARIATDEYFRLALQKIEGLL